MNIRRIFYIVFLITIDKTLYIILQKYKFNYVGLNIKIQVIDAFLNKGISFGYFSELKDINLFIIFLNFHLVLFFSFYYNRHVFLIAGALGNTISRMKNSAVTDYIYCSFFKKLEFICNVSDIFIFIGIIYFIYCIYMDNLTQ